MGFKFKVFFRRNENKKVPISWDSLLCHPDTLGKDPVNFYLIITGCVVVMPAFMRMMY